MAKKTLDFDSLGDLRGGAMREACMQALATILDDMINRPSLKTKRELVLKFAMTPCVEVSGNQINLVGCKTSYKIKTSIPEQSAAETECSMSRSGQLVFDDGVPEAGDEPTIIDEAERRRQERLEVSREHLRMAGNQ